jgi:hypothetical protein
MILFYETRRTVNIKILLLHIVTWKVPFLISSDADKVQVVQ